MMESLTQEQDKIDKESICAHKRKKTVIYIVLFALAGVLIAAGIANGGLRDVLIKAINICTECIGLG